MAYTEGQFSHTGNIGVSKYTGQINYDKKNQNYRVSGSGRGIGTKSDELYFSWTELQGDFIVRANIAFVKPALHSQALIGWHVRQNLEASSAQVSAVINSRGAAALLFRNRGNTVTDRYQLKTNDADVIQLQRLGNTFIMSAAKHGQPFAVTQVLHMELASKVLVGAALSSGNTEQVVSGRFSNLRIIKPAKPNFVPYQDYIGSNLEIMDMHTLQRRIIYRDPGSIQAPNWTRDGKKLIYNSNGLLFNYDLASNTLSTLNTGFANNNNNDHVLNWAGDEIAISHHNAADQGRSTIYTLPLSGSDRPKQITATGVGNSYLHGYSPDDKALVFTAERKNQWDIYKVSIATGEETQLTNSQGLDDGSEYSPDGRYVYFNSNRTGTMQLWRVKADGSEAEQLTFDRYNDWFPHLSPDGKKIVFLSYMDDIDAADHPFYCQVYLREMPAAGGEPRIIAYVYGGQGTINVPSWSPDGKYIAFVSNTNLSS